MTHAAFYVFDGMTAVFAGSEGVPMLAGGRAAGKLVERRAAVNAGWQRLQG